MIFHPTAAQKLRKKRGDGLSGSRLAFFASFFSALVPAALILAGTCSKTWAQPNENQVSDVGEHALGVGFGEVILAGGLEKNHSDSLGLSILYDYRASELFGLMVDLSYSKHTDDTGRNTLKILGASPSLRANLAYFDKLMAYMTVGFGVFQVSETLGLASGSVTTFGFTAGPGIELRLNTHLKFGILTTFHHLFTRSDPQAQNPAGKGLSIGGTYLRLFLSLQYVF